MWCLPQLRERSSQFIIFARHRHRIQHTASTRKATSADCQSRQRNLYTTSVWTPTGPCRRPTKAYSKQPHLSLHKQPRLQMSLASYPMASWTTYTHREWLDWRRTGSAFMYLHLWCSCRVSRWYSSRTRLQRRVPIQCQLKVTASQAQICDRWQLLGLEHDTLRYLLIDLNKFSKHRTRPHIHPIHHFLQVLVKF